MSELDDPQLANQTNRSAAKHHSEARETTRLARQDSTENGTESAPASIFPLVAGVDLDSYDEYESGAIDQHARCEYGARILAFGAIRRAVEIARQDDWASRGVWRRTTDEDAYAARERAASIRRAIRAAIRSDKA